MECVTFSLVHKKTEPGKSLGHGVGRRCGGSSSGDVEIPSPTGFGRGGVAGGGCHGGLVPTVKIYKNYAYKNKRPWKTSSFLIKSK